MLSLLKSKTRDRKNNFKGGMFENYLSFFVCFSFVRYLCFFT